MVTPVNFMAIAYGICDDNARTKTILDNIEAQMEKEKLFFWPLCMTSYAPGEGKDWQFPFPSYENGDLFLSWGSIGVAAYAGYKPELALKYVKNVLDQYGKDGLTFQRYGRVKQDGLGDDILSGNSLSIVGLYQAIYGINPLYNRFYLDPHITSGLNGTSLVYNFRGKHLTITLDSAAYSVSDKTFTVIANQSFGFNTTKNQLSYFNGNSAVVSLQAASAQGMSLDIKTWDRNKIEWEQNASRPVTYVVHQLNPNTVYQFAVNGRTVKNVKSNMDGELLLNDTPGSAVELIEISRK